MTPNPTLTILFSMLLAFILGLFIFRVYRVNYKGVMFSQKSALTLALMFIPSPYNDQGSERQEALLASLMAVDGVRDATLVAYQSETL